MLVLAHGLGGRTDLPLDAAGAVAGGGLAVLASFVALTGIWRAPRLHAGRGRPLPRALATALDAPGPRGLARVVVLVLAVAVVAVALAGPADTMRNPAPWAFYVTFWVGLVPVSLLLGPVWRVLNPLRTLHGGLRRVLGPARRTLPAGVGVWPAVAVLAGFAWLELVAPHRADPRVVGAVLLGYALVQLAAAAVVGEDWFGRADAFEVYSELIARMSPIGRGPDGVLVLRTPLAGLVAPVPPGTAAFACVLIGATGFDGLSRTAAWTQLAGTGAGAGTLGLAGCVAAVALLYAGALRLAGRDRLPARFAATLVPIAIGYAVAHYFSLLLLEGQLTVRLTGALLGLDGGAVSYGLLTPSLVALVQINGIVLGHIAATIAAHDLALRLRLRRRAELPLLVVMVALTCAGLAVLLSG